VAQKRGLTLIRDAEIEHIIGSYAAPLFKAAGLAPGAVRVHLVRDSALNAFVAGGQRVFINTGLILRSESPNQIVGVIAHETGHIAGGHLARTQDALKNASAQTIIAFILGAAAIVSGQGEMGNAILAGGRQVAERSLLRYSRSQEAAADQAALTFLERTGQSPRGLVEFLAILGDQEALLSSTQDPYARSHPISRERISLLRSRMESSPYADKSDSPETIAAFRRMQAKLTGFLEPPATTLRRYPTGDTSVPARYARAIAYHRMPALDKALAEIDGLLAEAPDDPFFHELKGQILYENGRVAEAVAPYERAVQLLPDSPLLLFGLAQAQIATGDPALNRAAIDRLRAAVRLQSQREGAGVWRLLAVAYGRDGRLGLSALASAEQALLEGRPGDAKQFAERAAKLLPRNSPNWIRTRDIAGAADQERKRHRGRKQKKN